MRAISASHLAAPAALVQREVHAQAMQVRCQPGTATSQCSRPAALEADARDVLVFARDDREARQDGVAVVAVVVDGVAPVGELAPHRVGEELVLRLGGPVLEARVPLVLALHLLQEHDVGVERAQASRSSWTTIRRLNWLNPLWML